MKALVAAGLVLMASLSACRQGSYTETRAADPSEGAGTAGDQSPSTADLGIARSIREAIAADPALSTNARYVTIISSNGVLTLRGSVYSASEKAAVGAAAQRAAGVTRVENDLEVASN